MLQSIGLCTNAAQKSQKHDAPVDMVKIVPGQVHLLGTNECTFGPAHWCQGHLHLLGTIRCTFGPAYWCHNMANAKK